MDTEIMEQLTKALRREQALLESLLFRLVETRLLLSTGEARFISRSTQEVERARQRACGADLARAAVVGGLAETPANVRPTSLRELAAHADDPWAGMLRDHHEALCALVAEIEVTAHLNAELARKGLVSLQTALGGSDIAATNDPTFTLVAGHSAYASVQGAADSLRMPALLAFLR